MDELKKKAEALGIKVDGRWSEDRLREEIEEAEKAKADEDEKARIAAEEQAKADADAKVKADEEARLAAEQTAREEAEAQAKKEADDKAAADAEEQARLDAQAEADRKAQEAAVAQEAEDGSVTIINLQANPNRNLGVEGYGEVTIHPSRLDALTVKRIQRGIDMGLLKVKE